MKILFKTIKTLFGICIILFSISDLHAKVKLPAILGDHMVLQQQTTVKLWGESTPKAKINIKTSWNNKTYTAASDNIGIIVLSWGGSKVEAWMSREAISPFIAGEDKVFHPAKAEIETRTARLAVSCKDVPNPVAVRYAYKNYVETSIFSIYGIPVTPFRTDNW